MAQIDERCNPGAAGCLATADSRLNTDGMGGGIFPRSISRRDAAPTIADAERFRILRLLLVT
jgi:hypothetical protein